MADAVARMMAVRPARDIFSPPALLLVLASALPCAWLGGEAALALGVHPAFGMFPGIAAPCLFARILFVMERREARRVDRENQRLGWAYQREETARRMAKFAGASTGAEARA